MGLCMFFFNRFLIVPNMGQSLQSVIDEDDGLAEKAVLQLACRLVSLVSSIHFTGCQKIIYNNTSIIFDTVPYRRGGSNCPSSWCEVRRIMEVRGESL